MRIDQQLATPAPTPGAWNFGGARPKPTIRVGVWCSYDCYRATALHERECARESNTAATRRQFDGVGRGCWETSMRHEVCAPADGCHWTVASCRSRHRRVPCPWPATRAGQGTLLSLPRGHETTLTCRLQWSCSAGAVVHGPRHSAHTQPTVRPSHLSNPYMVNRVLVGVLMAHATVSCASLGSYPSHTR